ncbi:hypothetical protein [Herbaspirillum sp. RV1423]|uniref:hypothetical protein n=1 Tax=Herbaspirillum sp. RV1423 TaxID=1443993 RepID=UPI001E454AF7|nr:hypothetical protein [Herbaspirillum sp. RV1423]
MSTEKTVAPPFRWLNPYRPTTFRVIVGLGIGAMVLLLINLFTPGALEASVYVWSLAAAAVAYVLAEFLLVTVVVVGPFAGFVYGVIAFFSR